MVNKFLDAVSRQLGTTFGTNYHYYVEDVEQNLEKPCFTLDVLTPMIRSTSPTLYDRTMPLVVHFFTNNVDNPKRDCYVIAERVMECLEYIPFENTLIRGENMSWQITDGVLQFFGTYKFTTKMEKTEMVMETLTETVARTR